MITVTDAPEAYDGFGTRTVEILGQLRGKPLRLVETPEDHVEWQRGCYLSGMYLASNREDFEKMLPLLRKWGDFQE